MWWVDNTTLTYKEWAHFKSICYDCHGYWVAGTDEGMEGTDWKLKRYIRNHRLYIHTRYEILPSFLKSDLW